MLQGLGFQARVGVILGLHYIGVTLGYIGDNGKENGSY